MGVQVEDTRICVVMVGLPARGKSLIAQKGRNLSAIVLEPGRGLPVPRSALLIAVQSFATLAGSA